MHQSEKFSLKDHLFNRTKVEKLASEINQVYAAFRKEKFIDNVVAEFPTLELKQRISWIAECLRKYLPNDYPVAVEIILKALPPENNPELLDNDFGDFIYSPYSEFVATYGLSKEYLDVSLNAIYEITKRFSAEYAIRFFINAFPEETIEKILIWTKDSNYHVRRLCSEGTRPKLPWAQKIHLPTSTSIQILDNLYFDKTRFVTRSVANHLNDISKIDADLVVETLIRWQKSNKQNEKEMEFIIKHALRTLIKEGNTKALNLIGLSHDTVVEISKFTLPKSVRMNTILEFSFDVTSEQDCDLLIDYVLYFQNKLGKLNGKKVFKLRRLKLKGKEKVHVSKRHTLRQIMTTRKLYPGEHKLEVQVNGKVLAGGSFELV